MSGDSGNNGSRNVQVFNIGSSGSVTLTHLNVVSGTASAGGGVYNAGMLTVIDSYFPATTMPMAIWAAGRSTATSS